MTLERMAKWENKIKLLLIKVDPTLEKQLFGPDQITFDKLLIKYKSGEDLAKNTKMKFDGYIDKVSINLKYLESKTEKEKKVYASIVKAKRRVDSSLELNRDIDFIQQIIKERKRQLISYATSVLRKNKYISKMQKEAWYYAETLRNYKAIFNDQAKAEQALKHILSKATGFKTFAERNSQIASIFQLPTSPNGTQITSANVVTGLQSRDAALRTLGGQMSSQGSLSKLLSQSIEDAHSAMNLLKEKLKCQGKGIDNGDLPDFKPNLQKTKTFWQRIEYGFDIQFDHSNKIIPSSSNLSLNVGYRLDDKRTFGIGAAYRLGLGSIQHVRFSSQGVGIKSYFDWKLKRSIFISGGYELNHYPNYKNIAVFKGVSDWQTSALLGITKKMPINKAYMKNAKVQLLFDFLSKQHIPPSQELILRFGYNF